VGFFKRLFSADYRAAVAAEAAGDLELAAERYALAGYHDAAARMHMARAERAPSHAEKITALRDALHWASEDGDLRRPAARTLGEALLARARAEGVATERDRERVREGARLLEEAGEFRAAGDAWESIGDDAEAARAYEAGGLVDRLEKTLARDNRRLEAERRLREAFADYELHMRSGRRDDARAALRRCVDQADAKAEYKRLLDQLESRLITGGQLVLRPRRAPGGRLLPVVACGRSPVVLGRDPLSDLVLRSGGVSRRHVDIEVGGAGAEPRFLLRDGGSRNGTLVGGLQVRGTLPLRDRGSFALGDACQIEFEVGGTPPVLVLRVVGGVDQGLALLAAGPGDRIDLGPLLGAPIVIRFDGGRPLLEAAPGSDLRLSGEPAAHGPSQLIHGDLVSAGDVELEVA
jgi:tetratricopeptide (TPR) repeat protein